MTKRIVCLMLCLAMALCGVCAAAEDYTLTEKLYRQVEVGSGIKGYFVLNAEGESEDAKALQPLNGTPIQIRAIKPQNQDKFQISLYIEDSEAQVGLTQLYGQGDDLFLRSELLPDLLLTYPTGGDVISRLLGQSLEENPVWYSAAANMLSIPEGIWMDTWAPLLESYYTDIELWLTDYASEPAMTRSEEGETMMTVSYTIPAAEIKAKIKSMLAKALYDQPLMELVKEQLSDQQSYVYLNAGYLYYYEAAIDALPLEGEIVLERDLSTMGEVESTMIQLPMPGENEWEILSIEQIGEDTTMTLIGTESAISLEMETASASEANAEYSGTVSIMEEGKERNIGFSLQKVFTHTEDEDTRAHDVTTWTLAISPDDDEALQTQLTTHYHSKNAKSNATTLEVTGWIQQGTDKLSLQGQIKTASPWVLDNLPTSGAEDLSVMTEAFRKEIFDQFKKSLFSAAQSLTSAAQ